ncbi:PREDICTED: putative pentatricopeptide repeat-containing protein At3g15200 [Tarenaya hassleriana]|uniref:putative pentatricopeptide repeat-containing protein At3g15200 n=1 Tax=Tarenaya hassleriana TaxID=28532 RepID=UPI00053C244F|nr:PREDICTED: putative pentatricopeptide repeat-containing protein At3g15200 [Tarenaya hassleriana]
MHGKIKFRILSELRNAPWRYRISSPSSSVALRSFLQPKRPNHEHILTISGFRFQKDRQAASFVHSASASGKFTDFNNTQFEQSAIDVHNILKNHRERSIEVIERVLHKCGIKLTERLCLDVLNRSRSDWRPAYILFELICKQDICLPGAAVYNQILDVLGKMRRFDEFHQVFDEMSKRNGLANEETYEVLLNRYAASHRVDEAIAIYGRRREFGIEDDLAAFQGLLMWLCRYKHVEVAETLFCSKRSEYGTVIKTMNIILNGWCVLGNVHEAKRFWKDILASDCKPDAFTYGTFINALTKKGKLGKAMELFRAMWKSGRVHDVKICNNVIDALCFKKRFPEAFEVLEEMIKRGCSPNVVTYNTFLKHLCKIRRTDKVYELLEVMEQRGGSCLPNEVTFSHLLKNSREPRDVEAISERMAKNRCNMTSDLYNMIFRLYMKWDCKERANEIWDEMERSGFGPDQRTYTIRVHCLHEHGRIAEALRYYREMVSRGLAPEPRTEALVKETKIDLKEFHAME